MTPNVDLEIDDSIKRWEGAAFNPASVDAEPPES